MDSTSVSLLRRLSDPTEETAWERFVELYTPVMFYCRRPKSLGSVMKSLRDWKRRTSTG